MSRMIPISELARHIVAEDKQAELELEHGPFDITRYTPQQQAALLSMRFNDEVAQAILLRIKHSTVAGMDFGGLRDMGLALRKIDGRYHKFTPRGQWVSAQVRRELAKKFEIEIPQQHVPETAAQRLSRERGRYNWANR